MMKRLLFALCVLTLISCKDNLDKKAEQLTYDEFDSNAKTDSTGLSRDSTFSQIANSPNSVVQTGMDSIKLIPVYKLKKTADRNIDYGTTTSYLYPTSDDEDVAFRYFMPGMDLLPGYNLINVAHYDLPTQKLSYFFTKPALIRNVYYPGVRPDSLYKKPVKRDFFLVSVYDEDTNKDSIINKKDLRRLYFIDAKNTRKILLVPSTHSVVRSTYDDKSDIMYVYARFDANKNGSPERNEPMSIFWIAMHNPTEARKLM
ncbi:hypothetical protein [Flavobacterium silvaticum]|uniref:Uncharacterized protein n=1 Tax=Flavobacterium silvaticum TaxID=1852020 RepID=A0A972JFD6_9FLAO|nr:hypothetical protein [Flavobacterium silvaticum]NMH27839.1 hypothetical protein [Flavobacterium silvaticum]